MDKRMREISRIFVAPPRVSPLSVCARARESTHRFIHKSSSVYALNRENRKSKKQKLLIARKL